MDAATPPSVLAIPASTSSVPVTTMPTLPGLLPAPTPSTPATVLPITSNVSASTVVVFIYAIITENSSNRALEARINVNRIEEFLGTFKACLKVQGSIQSLSDVANGTLNYYTTCSTARPSTSDMLRIWAGIASIEALLPQAAQEIRNQEYFLEFFEAFEVLFCKMALELEETARNRVNPEARRQQLNRRKGIVQALNGLARCAGALAKLLELEISFIKSTRKDLGKITFNAKTMGMEKLKMDASDVEMGYCTRLLYLCGELLASGQLYQLKTKALLDSVREGTLGVGR